MRRRVAIAGVASALLLAISTPAPALPGDEWFGPAAPADGATFAPNPDGIPVAFTCPVYRVFTAGEGFTIFGGPSDYGVSFATAPALGGDGRLRSDLVVALDTGHTSSTALQGQCVATFAAGGSERPQERPGTYWWQVWRRCTGCASGYETAAPRRLVLRTPGRPRLAPQGAVYAGFAAAYAIRLPGAADGARATLQRRVGGAWRALGSDALLDGAGEVVAKLPGGAQRLRAVVRVGDETMVGAERAVTVKPARGWTTGPGADGTYAARLGVSLRVADGGRTIRAFEADVAMLCPGVAGGRFTTQFGQSSLARIPIAPDGRFIAALTRRGSATLVRGRVAAGRVTGSAQLSVGSCTGVTRFAARR